MSPKLTCPDCGATTVTKLEKLKIAALGSKAQCKKCRATLTAGGKWVGLLLGACLGSGLLAILAYSAHIGHWWPVIISLTIVLVTPTVVGYFMGLRRIGTKSFSIE